MNSPSLLWTRLSDRTWIEVEGKDGGNHLHRFCTQDIQSLPAGSGREALFLDAKGRVVGWGEIFRDELEPARYWIVAAGSQATRLIAHLDRYVIREDVKFNDRSQELVSFLLRVSDLQLLFPLGLSDARPLEPGQLRSFSLHRSADSATTVAQDALLIASREFGSNDYLLVVSQSAGPQVEAFLEAFAEGKRDDRWAEAIRIAQGFPRFEVDMDDKTLPQELSRSASSIHFQKGCYLGQETVARIDAMGHVNRVLVRVFGEGPLPSVPAMLTDGQTDVGRVTSVAPVQADCGREPAADWIALATVKRSALKNRSPLTLTGLGVPVSVASETEA